MSVSGSPPPPDEARRVGLCLACRHAKRVESAKGSVFYLCLRSREDARYRKYPPLPVRSCEGHEPATLPEK